MVPNILVNINDGYPKKFYHFNSLPRNHFEGLPLIQYKGEGSQPFFERSCLSKGSGYLLDDKGALCRNKIKQKTSLACLSLGEDVPMLEVTTLVNHALVIHLFGRRMGMETYRK